jgi:hypothetical protein
MALWNVQMWGVLHVHSRCSEKSFAIKANRGVVMGTTAVAPGIITNSTFTLTDRIRIQQEHIRTRNYTQIGKLTCIVWEGQKSTRGFSQENDVSDAFGKWKRKTWASCTLDWLNHRNAPIIAVSRDRNDLLLPFRMDRLPDIPDPRWKGFTTAPAADCTKPEIPRIPQLFAGCPVVGDRACGRITDRVSGKTFLIFRPLTEMQVMCGRGKDSGFGRISCMTDPADRTMAALLVMIEPDNEGKHEAYFVGGSFHAG